MEEKPRLNKAFPKELTPESTASSLKPLPSIEEQDKILYRQFLALKGYPKKTPDPSCFTIMEGNMDWQQMPRLLQKNGVFYSN